jgi:hypothetical protein
VCVCLKGEMVSELFMNSSCRRISDQRSLSF